MSASSSSTEKLFDDIAAFISESRSLLESGALMELTGLDDQVRSLCESMLQLSDDERMIYADRLQQLLGDLKLLADSLVEKREAVALEIRNLPQHRKATIAYRTVEASDMSDNDDDQ